MRKMGAGGGGGKDGAAGVREVERQLWRGSASYLQWLGEPTGLKAWLRTAEGAEWVNRGEAGKLLELLADERLEAGKKAKRLEEDWLNRLGDHVRALIEVWLRVIDRGWQAGREGHWAAS